MLHPICGIKQTDMKTCFNHYYNHISCFLTYSNLPTCAISLGLQKHQIHTAVSDDILSLKLEEKDKMDLHEAMFIKLLNKYIDLWSHHNSLGI